jgi:undecaprenyl-diphosphatase
MMIEIPVIQTIQSAATASPLMIAVAIFMARWLIYIFVGFALFLIVSPRSERRHAASEMAWSALLALALTSLIAALVERPRPFFLPSDLGFDITRLIPIPFNSSFPSGHTSAAFAMASALAWVDRRWGVVALLIALLVGLGRVAVGVHYPSDILGGMVVGVGAFLVVRFLHGQLRKKNLLTSAKLHQHP